MWRHWRASRDESPAECLAARGVTCPDRGGDRRCPRGRTLPAEVKRDI